MSTNPQSDWRKCSSCKKPIPFSSKYYACSVSTCNGIRTGYVFCSVSCFERHLPGARHKDAAAIENTSPAPSTMVESSARSPQRTIIRPAGTNATPASQASRGSGTEEVLVIASRLKEYIAKRSEFNTSASVMDVLSDHLRVLADRAIENARAEGRKTVMDRDFSFLRANR